MKIFIYALIDPRTDEMRYIGKTCNPKERLATHIREARNGSILHSRRWIHGVTLSGNLPELVILEECENNDLANESEKFWIASMKFIGCNLTNKTSGGDGQSLGYKPTPEVIEKIRLAGLGKKRSEETRNRIKIAFNTPEMKTRRKQIVEELKKNNPKWLEKVRYGRTGQPMSEEAKKKISNSWTPERKAIHALKQRSLPFDDRRKAQLKAALKSRWDKYRAATCSPSA